MRVEKHFQYTVVNSMFKGAQVFYRSRDDISHNSKHKKESDRGEAGHWNLHWNSLRSFLLVVLKLGKRSGHFSSKACIF